jgi:ParB/RepB/Spo0J family partition protein
MPVSKQVPVHLIDDPDIAMRSDISEDGIVSLAANIEAVGLINAVAVTKDGQRYKLHVGHRRLLAFRHLKRDMIDVRDYTDDPVNLEAIKFAENYQRVDVSDADMAIYLDDLVNKSNYNVEQLMAITGESESWINRRLALFHGDQEVFMALRADKIKLGHAELLNRFPVEYRQMYLATVIESTPPVSLLKTWLARVKTQPTAEAQAQPAGDVQVQPVPLPGVVLDKCEACQGTELNWTMKFVRVHGHCWDIVIQALAAANKGG